ncbi:MAG: protein kinase [Kofleriaceae bacterium]
MKGQPTIRSGSPIRDPDRYEILGEHGRGGLGRVSRAPGRPLIAERKTIDERIRLLHHVIAVADAIAYAHGRNIIRRDLKPANVIVGDFGETVVIDWGLAKDLSDPTDVSGGGGSLQSLDDQLTSAGSVLGTPLTWRPNRWPRRFSAFRARVAACGPPCTRAMATAS